MEFRYCTPDSQESQIVRILERPTGFDIQIGDRHYHVKAHEINPSTLDLWINGHYQRVRYASQGADRWLALNGQTYHVIREERRRRRHASSDGQNTLTSTMPGQITAVLVSAGERVERGQSLVLMEAMKMELRIVASHDGVIAKVFVREGEAVERGQTLVEMGEDE